MNNLVTEISQTSNNLIIRVTAHHGYYIIKPLSANTDVDELFCTVSVLYEHTKKTLVGLQFFPADNGNCARNLSVIRSYLSCKRQLVSDYIILCYPVRGNLSVTRSYFVILYEKICPNALPSIAKCTCTVGNDVE